MNSKYIVLLLMVFTLLPACKQEKKNMETGEESSKMEEVMAIHDEVMPKMGTIGKLVAELKPRIDSTSTGQEYEKAMKDLQAAHQSMMDWMQGFGSRFDSDEILNGKALTDQKKAWLGEEEVKVKELRDQINSSIEKAEALLEGE